MIGQVIIQKMISYTSFKKYFKSHIERVVEPQELEAVLSWVHIAIGNAKDYYLKCIINLKQSFYNVISMNSAVNFEEQLFDRLAFAIILYQLDFRTRIYNRMLCG